MDLQIRRAVSSDADLLTEIAHAAKRHWGYPESWIEYWKEYLTITPEFVSANEVFVAVIDGEVAGCCALVMSDNPAELEHLWITPQHMGSGVGRALFQHASERAVSLGLQVLELSADPNAEGFYKRMGARRIGEVRGEIAGKPRVLPRMAVNLSTVRKSLESRL
jgi:N-acetylglutamate synthase-like GNAT family acetyltransferase